MDDREQRIRERAHQIWERDGRPEGLERDHWDRAAREIEFEDGGEGSLAEASRLTDEFEPPRNGGGSGLSSSLQPGGTVPGDVKNAGVGSVGTGADSTGGRAGGTARRSRG